MDSELDNIVKKLDENRFRLVIARIPIPTKMKFKDLAEVEFAGDYGMLLKWLLDFYLLSLGNEEIYAHLANLEERVGKLENPKQPEPEYITKHMVDGREFKIRKRGGTDERH